MAEPEYIPPDPDPVKRRYDSNRNLAVLVYILHGLAFFTGGMTALIGVIINYAKLGDVENTWVEPHFRWQIRTFWIGLLWAVIGLITLPLVIGFFILVGVFIWFIYRIVKGALALNDGRSP